MPKTRISMIIKYLTKSIYIYSSSFLYVFVKQRNSQNAQAVVLRSWTYVGIYICTFYLVFEDYITLKIFKLIIVNIIS